MATCLIASRVYLWLTLHVIWLHVIAISFVICYIHKVFGWKLVRPKSKCIFLTGLGTVPHQHTQNLFTKYTVSILFWFHLFLKICLFIINKGKRLIADGEFSMIWHKGTVLWNVWRIPCSVYDYDEYKVWFHALYDRCLDYCVEKFDLISDRTVLEVELIVNCNVIIFSIFGLWWQWKAAVLKFYPYLKYPRRF